VVKMKPLCLRLVFDKHGPDGRGAAAKHVLQRLRHAPNPRAGAGRQHHHAAHGRVAGLSRGRLQSSQAERPVRIVLRAARPCGLAPCPVRILARTRVSAEPSGACVCERRHAHRLPLLRLAAAAEVDDAAQQRNQHEGVDRKKQLFGRRLHVAHLHTAGHPLHQARQPPGGAAAADHSESSVICHPSGDSGLG